MRLSGQNDVDTKSIGDTESVKTGLK